MINAGNQQYLQTRYTKHGTQHQQIPATVATMINNMLNIPITVSYAVS